MSKGFIATHRKILDWQWYKDIPTFKLFMHLLLNANHKPKKWKDIDIKRGEFLTGLIRLAQDTGLSPQQVRTAINKLKSTNEITSKSTNRFTIIKLLNYSIYQDKKEEINKQINKQINKRITNKQQTDNKRITTTKNVNNVNNVNNKNSVPLFDPKKSPPQKYNSFQFQVAKQLGTHIKSIKNISLKKGDIKRWANEIRLLQEIDLKPRGEQQSTEDITAAMEAIIKYGSSTEFFPVVESGGAFRDKFLKIENFLNQSSKKPKVVKDWESYNSKSKSKSKL